MVELRRRYRVARHSGSVKGQTLCLLAAGWFCFATVSAAADLTAANRLFQTGKYAECLQSCTEGLKSSDWQEGLWLLKLRTEMELGRYTDAAATLDAALKKFPDSLQLRWLGLDVCRFTQQADRPARLEAEMTELLKRSPWRYSDSANQVIVGRWMLSQRADAKKVLSTVLNEAKRRTPSNVDLWLAIGDLALDKHDYKLAGDSFQQAVKLDAENPDAHFGVAQAFAPSDSKKAEAEFAAALAINPQHVPTLLALVDELVDAERYDEAAKTLDQITDVNARHPTALAYRAVIAHLKNQPEQEKSHRAAALKSWTANPAVDHLIGLKLAQKYRFAEGSKYQRDALKLEPQFLPAKSQLAQDLLRLGQEEEGLKLAAEVYDADGYNIFAHNLVALEESLAKFRTLEAEGLLVRMEAREADIYGPRVVALLQRARAKLAKKYGVMLEEPVIVEMFPRQQDFAIRTFGLPGGAGFLGVCFGRVITANSPASQATHPSCWEATLWHEFCHVVTLNKTKNKMPRWLSEGISVYEERLADPTWGQTMTPQYREMILGTDLTPASKLSGAFLNPKSGLHLQFAYYESSLVVEYLVGKFGPRTLELILDDLAMGMTINDSLARHAGSIDALDQEFAKFAREQAQALAPEADWTTPELPRRATAEVVADFVKEHPKNYAALRRLAGLQVAAKKWNEAQATLETMCRLYPADGSGTSPYALLAKVHREKGDQAAERKALEKLATLTSSEPDVFDRLCELTIQAEDWPAAKKAVLQSLAVNPLSPTVQRNAAVVATKLNDKELAVASYRALLLLGSIDAADTHYQLASLLHQQGNGAEARRHILLALEEAPRFRAAQKLLLQLVAVNPTPEKPEVKDTKAELPPKSATEKPKSSTTPAVPQEKKSR